MIFGAMISSILTIILSLDAFLGIDVAEGSGGS